MQEPMYASVLHCSRVGHLLSQQNTRHRGIVLNTGQMTDFTNKQIRMSRTKFVTRSPKLLFCVLNPLVPDADYSERQDQPFFYKLND